MITGKTKSGFEFAIQDGAENDMELLEGITDLDNGDLSHIRQTVTALLGKEQKTKLYNFLRDKGTGRVPIDKVMEALGEIFQAANGDLKN